MLLEKEKELVIQQAIKPHTLENNVWSAQHKVGVYTASLRDGQGTCELCQVTTTPVSTGYFTVVPPFYDWRPLRQWCDDCCKAYHHLVAPIDGLSCNAIPLFTTWTHDVPTGQYKTLNWKVKRSSGVIEDGWKPHTYAKPGEVSYIWAIVSTTIDNLPVEKQPPLWTDMTPEQRTLMCKEKYTLFLNLEKDGVTSFVRQYFHSLPTANDERMEEVLRRIAAHHWR